MAAEQQFDSILENGWRQGSILSQELVVAADLPIQNSPVQYYIVVSHSCDLTNPRADCEPVAEVLRAELTTAFDKGSASARTPRKLALLAIGIGDTEVPLLVKIETRQFVGRELFLAHRPHPDIRLPADQVTMLAIWMSRRYRRPELPTEFVNRLGENYVAFKNLGRRHRATFSRILISLSSWAELAEDQVYRVKVLGLLAPSQTISKSAMDWATTVDTLLSKGVEGIEAELTDIESESNVSIATLRQFRTFDFDFLSFSAGEFDLRGDD